MFGGLRRRGRRRIGVQQLREAEDRIERRAQLVTHVAKGIPDFAALASSAAKRGALEFDILFEQSAVETLAFRHVARGGTNTPFSSPSRSEQRGSVKR